MQAKDEIAGKVVADFCCGTGMYTAAACQLNAKEVYAFDIEEAALEQCKAMLADCDSTVYHIEKLDLTDSAGIQKYKLAFDTVVMNPPFGTKDNAGIDMRLLQNAVSVRMNAYA